MNSLKDFKSLEKIEVNTSNLGFKFYRALGFESEYVKKDYWSQGIDLYFMSLKISKRS